MIPGYKVILFSSFGASMYMMGRLVLVSTPCRHCKDMANICKGTQDLARKELDCTSRA